MTLAALRNANFRRYWIALIISAIGTWMQIVAQSLLVLQLSHGDPAPLGLVALAQAAAFFLFALFGGSVVDRMDRRRLLLITQSLLMTIALILGFLVAAQTIRIWIIVVATFLSGAVLSFDQPARSAFLPSLVPDPDLPSAISLQSTVFTSAAVVAPVLAGLSIARFGFAGNYFLNAASYLVAICALFTLRLTSLKSSAPRNRVSLRQSIHEGVQAVRRDPVLVRAVSGYALLLFVAPSMQILLPVLVDRVLHQGATLLGFFLAAFGVGAIGGALLVPWLTGVFGAETLYLSCFAVCAAALAIVGSTRRIAIYFIMLLLLGASQNAINTLTITLMQSRVAKEMRGRVMSLQTLLLMGVRPLGDFPLSLLLAAIGASLTAGISAALIGSYGLFLGSTRYRNPSVTSQARAAKLR